MMQRCYRVKEKAYAWYGAKGINVCYRWHDFQAFLSDMGEAPIGMEIDRINSLGNYCKENCKWSTRTEQIRNRSNTVKLEYNGSIKPMAEWAEIIGLNYKCLARRIWLGWTTEKALTTPIIECQRR